MRVLELIVCNISGNTSVDHDYGCIIGQKESWLVCVSLSETTFPGPIPMSEAEKLGTTASGNNSICAAVILQALWKCECTQSYNVILPLSHG